MAHEDAAACREFALDQLACLLELGFVIPGLTRMTTVESGINVNVIRSPGFIERLSLISLGIVV
jgi:hypothetical protein